MKKRLKHIGAGWNRKHYIALILIILFLVFISGAYLFKSYKHYFAWREHHKYFGESSPKIEEWMTLRTIEKNFNISKESLDNFLGANSSLINPHMSLDNFCRHYHKNCTEIVLGFNNLKNG